MIIALKANATSSDIGVSIYTMKEKKVLGLIVSQRKLGNSELLVKEIMRSVPEECKREIIRLPDLTIKPCNACYRCLQPHEKCPIKDDFNFVLNKIREADALVIGVPVYFLGPHGSYKMLTDRLLGVANYASDTEGKPCIIAIPYGAKGWEGYSKAASLITPRLFKMNIVDCWLINASLPGESLLNSDNLSYAQTLGENLFSGKLNYTPGPAECPYCGSDLLRFISANKVECSICSAQGVVNDSGFPDFQDATYTRFSKQKMDEHFKGWLIEMKNRFLSEKERLKEIQNRYRD